MTDNKQIWVNEKSFFESLNLIYVNIANWFWANNYSYNQLNNNEKVDIINHIQEDTSEMINLYIKDTNLSINDVKQFTNDWWYPIILNNNSIFQ